MNETNRKHLALELRAVGEISSRGAVILNARGGAAEKWRVTGNAYEAT